MNLEHYTYQEFFTSPLCLSHCSGSDRIKKLLLRWRPFLKNNHQVCIRQITIIASAVRSPFTHCIQLDMCIYMYYTPSITKSPGYIDSHFVLVATVFYISSILHHHKTVHQSNRFAHSMLIYQGNDSSFKSCPLVRNCINNLLQITSSPGKKRSHNSKSEANCSLADRHG
jgi:hypothetical protein